MDRIEHLLRRRDQLVDSREAELQANLNAISRTQRDGDRRGNQGRSHRPMTPLAFHQSAYPLSRLIVSRWNSAILRTNAHTSVVPTGASRSLFAA